MSGSQQALPPSPLPAIYWERWNGWQVPGQVLEQSRREPLLQPEMYAHRVQSFTRRIKKVTDKVPAQIEPGVDALFVATQQRLQDALDWLSLQYSAGSSVEQMREVWPYVLRWAEEYGMFHEAHHLDPANQGGVVPHAALRTEDYWMVALRLVCFGLLTGHVAEMPRVMKFLDYGNELMGVRDGLIERLVRPFVPDRPAPPDTATRHLPYRKLFKVFAAAPEKRPALMCQYLDEWYEASRREPYIDQHGEAAVLFYGYWAWEAAAVAWLLDIEDGSFRHMSFYPSDLVDYAKQHAPMPQDAPRSQSADGYLRVTGGEACPRSGYWSTPARSGSRQRFEAGEPMPDLGGDYGVTIWQWDDKQD